jgi:hypothetical protein
MSWPDGKAVLDKMCASPALFAMAVNQSKRASQGVGDYLFEPSRFRNALEPAAGEDLNAALGLLAGYGNDEGWSFWMQTDRTRAVDIALTESTNAAWRAAAVFSLGLRMDGNQSAAIFEKAVTDSDPWVRAAGAAALARHSKDRDILEQRLAPLLADTDQHVAEVAACALLEPELRDAAGLSSTLDYFQFNDHYGGASTTRTTSERPLTTLETKPVFLASARKWLSATNEDSSAFAILLAQYGEFDGIDQLVARRAEADTESFRQANYAVLAGIALSHDAKYLPALRQIAAKADGEWDLRRILQALKGMTGPEARQLRLDINKRIRDTGSSGARNFD